MRLSVAVALLSGYVISARCPMVLAQPAPSQVQAPLYDPQQLPAYKGQVQQFTLTPRGDIDGLILSDGTEVLTPPHLSTEIAYVVKPGDKVVVNGLHAAALPLVQAVSVTDQTSARTVTDVSPPPPGLGAPPPIPLGMSPGTGPLPGLTEVRGRVRMMLHGRQGEVNGALLEDGTLLRLPPPDAYRFAAYLQVGQRVVAEGNEFSNALGKVLDVQQLGPSREQLSEVQGPAEPGPRGRRGPPPPGVAMAPPLPPWPPGVTR